MQARVEVLDALRDVLQLALVGALDLAGLADGHVQGQLDAAVGVRGVEPVLAAAVAARREAEPVLARLVRREGEAAGRHAALGDDAVVVVEDFLFGEGRERGRELRRCGAEQSRAVRCATGSGE